MRKISYILSTAFLLISSVRLVGQEHDKTRAVLLTVKTQFEAGQDIVLKFSVANDSLPVLYCSNSYGMLLIDPALKNNILEYKIPDVMANRSGLVNWKLLNADKTLSGEFYINPKEHPETMETYLGPPTIEAGGRDYTMFVVIPTDIYGNALKDSTEVTVNHQFLASEYTNRVLTHDLIAYKNLYSYKKTGRMAIGSKTFETNSKEYIIDVLPAIPTDFKISYERNHNYADGNQVTSFFTSIIRDRNDNVVSDGTLVTFYITSKTRHILKTSAPTINGIAIAKMVHPDHGDTWTVQAFIEGMAESDTILFDFKQIITDYKVVFSNNNRTITVGPLQSFMDQMMPDGLQVKLYIYRDNTKLDMILKESFEGFVTYRLNSNEIPGGTYKMIIETARIEKIFENIKL